MKELTLTFSSLLIHVGTMLVEYSYASPLVVDAERTQRN